MDDLPTNRTPVTVPHPAAVTCPVPRCPWTYDQTNPRTAERDDGGRRWEIPPPAGEHLQPTEIEAGTAAAATLMAARPPTRDVLAAVDLVVAAAHAQDDAVTTAHIGGHSYADLTAAYGDDLAAALTVLSAAGHHPPVSIPMPDGHRVVAYWEDDGPASGYRCSVCRTVQASGPRTAQHFIDEHVFVSAGLFGRRG